MAAIYSNGNRWNILGFNFTKRDALSSVYKISMVCACLSTQQLKNIKRITAVRTFVRMMEIAQEQIS